jgi:hypothetical protein
LTDTFLTPTKHFMLLILVLHAGGCAGGDIARQGPAATASQAGSTRGPQQSAVKEYDLPVWFTTKAYQNQALTRMSEEANGVAHALNLPEKLPIVEKSLVAKYISPPLLARGLGGVGNITSENFMYCVSRGKKFSYLIGTHQEDDCRLWQQQHSWSKTNADSQVAYQLATQWLAAVSMDVQGLNRDLRLVVKPDSISHRPERGTFLPVYRVSSCKKWKSTPGFNYSNKPEWEPVASVRVFVPTKTLMELRVEDSKYILRAPVVFTNLDFLLSQTNELDTPHD